MEKRREQHRDSVLDWPFLVSVTLDWRSTYGHSIWLTPSSRLVLLARWLVTPPLTIIGTVKHKALVPAWRWGSQALGKSQMKLSWTNREVKVKCREKTREKAGPDPDTAVWLVNRSFTLCSLSCGGAFIRLCYFPSTTVQFSTGYLLGANERSEVKRSIHFPICYVPCVRLAPTVYYRLVRSSNKY